MDTKTFVLDTNIFIRDINALYAFGDNDIYLPLVVIEELDNLKTAPNGVGFAARETSRIIGNLLHRGKLADGVKIDKGLGKLYVKPHFSNGNNDDVIIDFAKNLSSVRENVILVSKDTNVRIKADALGVQTEDYKHDLIDNIQPIDNYTFTIDKDIVEYIYQNGEVKTDSGDFYEGQYLLLKAKYNPKMGVIVVYEDGFFKRIHDISTLSIGITPRNAEQRMLMDAILSNSGVIFVTGTAGVGKTLITLASSLELLEEKQFKKIMLVKSVVNVGGRQEELGFLPGSEQEKLHPFFASFDDNLEFIMGENYIELINQNIIEKQPIAFMRGRTINNTIVIVDESQNLELSVIKTLISRIGHNSKIIFMGDPYQVDVPTLNSFDNGLVLAIEALKGNKNVSIVNMFNNNRSEVSKLAELL